MPDVTWWGHATCTIDDRGVRVLTDPLFCSRLGHLRRRRGPLPDDRSRRADLAVVSHLHADHLHFGSLSVLPRHIPVAVPSGALRAVPGLRRLRDRELIEVAPGDTVRVGMSSSRWFRPSMTATGGPGLGDRHLPSGTS